ncbi:MAG TPA: hypothetical protein VM052_07750, partial [Candidatus Limnocylindrales bacterium]|nr:hypothetical protein [Candidatus Limnocylindrales bacterium]
LVQEPVERTEKGWKILVPRNQRLDAFAKPSLSAIAFGSGTERTRARTEEREREATLERRIAKLEGAIAEYVAQRAAPPPTALGDAPNTAQIDVLALSFEDLLAWLATNDFTRANVDPMTRAAYILAAEHLFFQPVIAEHDAAKAIVLLLLSEEWGKAGSIFLYAIDLARNLPHIATPSVIDLFESTPLPAAMSRDLQIVLRSTQIAARRRHRRPVEALLLDLDHLVAKADTNDAWAVTVAAFGESRMSGRRAPDRALRYIHVAATLRPGATGYDKLPFPPSIDAAWPLMLELTAAGVTTEATLRAWLAALAAIPADARSAVVADEMNAVTLANRFWLDESAKPAPERTWAPIHRVLEQIEAWSEEHGAPILFASARRGRVVIRGEYEDDLRGAIALATDVPRFVRDDPHAMFLLNEIAASQFLYANTSMESFVAFRAALAYRPVGSSLLSTTLLKAAQAAGAAGEFTQGVAWAREAIDVIDASTYRVPTDSAVARAEYALALWFAGERDEALSAWDRATEELLATEDDTARWRGLAVRFHYVGGYLACTARWGTPPTVDADGKPYVEPRPGAFLIDLASQAPAYTDNVRFGILLSVTMMSDQRAADARANSWVGRALAFAGEHLPHHEPMLAIPALPHLIADGHYANAVELARRMVQGWKAQDVMKGADGEQVAASFSVLPAILAIARKHADDPRGAAEAAEPLVAACRAAAQASRHTIWSDCAMLLETAFVSATDTPERIAVIHAIAAAASDAADVSPLPALCEVCKSVLPGIDAKAALAAHSRALSGVQARLSVFPTMYRMHVVPFFAETWERRIAREPAAFLDPADVHAAIANSTILPVIDRPRAILLAIARGLVR